VPEGLGRQVEAEQEAEGHDLGLVWAVERPAGPNPGSASAGPGLARPAKAANFAAEGSGWPADGWAGLAQQVQQRQLPGLAQLVGGYLLDQGPPRLGTEPLPGLEGLLAVGSRAQLPGLELAQQRLGGSELLGRP